MYKKTVKNAEINRVYHDQQPSIRVVRQFHNIQRRRFATKTQFKTPAGKSCAKNMCRKIGKSI